MKPTRVLLTAASTLFVSQVMAGEAVFYITEDGTSMADVAVTVDGKKQLVGKSGFVTFDISSGTHKVELSQYGEWVGDFEFATASSAENAEIQVEVLGGEALEEVLVYTPGQEEAPAVGQISGYLESDETGGAVSGARISIAGTEQAVMTDEEGFFAFELPRGEYDIAIAHPNYGKRDVSGVRVMSNVNTGVNLTLSLSGDGVIEEVVAVGSYIPNTVTAQQRDSSAVLDAIGSEQFSRFGDSNAASALKRVSGVKIADGKYAVVRGLNERYTTVSFNGANIPSPDPSRRVVPLDIFPSGIISSISVQKSASADRPASATGASIDILSKEAPEEFEGKLSASIEYADGTTGESARVQKTEGMEFLGFGSSDRDISGGAKGIASSRDTVSGNQAINAMDLGQLETEDQTLLPNTSIEITMGDMLAETDYGTWTYQVTGKYSNKWNVEESDRAQIEPVGSNVIESDEYVQTRVVNDIDLNAGLSITLRTDNHTITSNSLVLRQTQSDNIETLGVRGENRNATLTREYAWRERQFLMQQFVGEYYIDSEYETDIKWGVTYAEASQNSPDTRKYNFNNADVIATDNVFNPKASIQGKVLTLDVETSPQRQFDELTDESLDLYVSGNTSIWMNDNYGIKAKYGISTFSRERDAESYVLQYELTDAFDDNLPDRYTGVTDISQVVNAESITQGIFEVDGNATNNEASYTGTWDYTAFYIQPSFEWYDVLNVELGLRSESSDLSIETNADPDTGEIVRAKLDESEIYPSLNLTYFVMEEAQLRFAFYQTVNRPDFREVAPAQFNDPISGDLYEGNPNLTSSDVTSIDLRGEYYFSDDESVTLAVFRKDFTDTIERTVGRIAGSANTPLFMYENAGDGNVQGIELGFSKGYEEENLHYKISGNLSLIDSEVDEINNSGIVTSTRQLQGQADVLSNLQVAIDELDSGREYTLIVNYTGESLDSLSVNNQLDDQYRDARAVVDFNFKQPLLDDQMDLKAQISNLTDSEVVITQNGREVRSYKPGTKIKVGVSYLF